MEHFGPKTKATGSRKKMGSVDSTQYCGSDRPLDATKKFRNKITARNDFYWRDRDDRNNETTLAGIPHRGLVSRHVYGVGLLIRRCDISSGIPSRRPRHFSPHVDHGSCDGCNSYRDNLFAVGEALG